MRVVIMGGTSGIGRATAGRLAADGAEVIVTGHDATKIGKWGSDAGRAEAVDGTSPEAVSGFFARVGAFDHLVLAFSPGAVGLGPLRDTAVANIEAAFAGKLFAYLVAIQYAEVRGSITMISASTARVRSQERSAWRP